MSSLDRWLFSAAPPRRVIGVHSNIELRLAREAAFISQRFDLPRDAATRPIVCHTQPEAGRGATSCNETSLPTQRPRISPT
jgi:hypothetical protein